MIVKKKKLEETILYYVVQPPDGAAALYNEDTNLNIYNYSQIGFISNFILIYTDYQAHVHGIWFGFEWETLQNYNYAWLPQHHFAN